MLWKCCTQYASTFGKLNSGHRNEKVQFSFQSQRKAMPKNSQTAAQLHSSHTLAKWCWKFFKPGFNYIELPDVQTGFRKGRGTRDYIASTCWIILLEKARESQKTIYFCFIDYAKFFDYMHHKKLWKTLKEMGIPDHLPASREICMQVKKHQLELDMEQTGS